MNSIEMLDIITRGNWRNSETNEEYSFSWSDLDESITIHFKSGDKAGHKDSHKFVKLYTSKEKSEDYSILRFESNLFKTICKLHSEDGSLLIDSDVFGKMKLVRN